MRNNGEICRTQVTPTATPTATDTATATATVTDTVTATATATTTDFQYKRNSPTKKLTPFVTELVASLRVLII